MRAEGGTVTIRPAARGSTSSESGSSHFTSCDSEREDADATATDLCLHYLRTKSCTRRRACPDHHSQSPYRWQILTDGEWENLEPNEVIERTFSRPQNHSYRLTATNSDSLIGYLEFDTMTCYGPQTRPVRRLSVPSVDRWTWYFKDKYEEWVKFGEQNSWGIITGPTSTEIEEFYINNPHVRIKYNDSDLDLTKMCLSTATQRRPIRRRPEFQTRSQAASTMVYWDSSVEEAIPQLFTVSYEADYTMSVLNECSPEYKLVAERFHKTMFKNNFTISSINRVHNPSLWDTYQRYIVTIGFNLKKEKMRRDNGENYVRERRLFHKTRKQAQNAICRRNFDMRYSRDGLMLGRGVYFSWNAYYCHTFFERHRNDKGDMVCMFLARVLCGNSCSKERMQSHFLHPPSKDRSLVNIYDSAVDNLQNPLISAIFYSDHVYPEYIINYC